MMVVSIDPGEVHNGVAWWTDEELPGTGEGQGVWRAWKIEELDPPRLYWALEAAIAAGIGRVIVEEFRLYPGKASEQGYSTMATCEVIGVIKYLCERGGVGLAMQPASIKNPVRARAKANGWPQQAVIQGKGGHCADAELHGLYWLATTGRIKL